MSGPRFPGAPPGSHVCAEGWLIVGDEAWTQHEWWTAQGLLPDENCSKYQRRYRTDEERRQARLETNRRYMRRRRGAA